MNLRTVLIDDEPNNLENLARLLDTYCPELHIVATAMDARSGKEIILKHQPDLVFLDIQMPGENGFDLLRSLDRYDFEIIFVTAYDQYGIQAVKFAAVDYLLKPVHIDELQLAVKKARSRQGQKTHNMQLENLISLLKQQQDKDEHRIALATLRETRLIPTMQIIRVESSNNYSHFYLSGGEKLTVSKAIHEYEELLKDYGFIRCHQSHLVSKRFVKSWIKEDGGYLLLETGERLPVSRNKKNSVMAALEP